VEVTWGIVPADALQRLVVVSPHFDDAVLGAAHVLGSYPGTAVITVLGGRPSSYPAEPSQWDADGGFRSGDDVVAVRREEDRAALQVLEATPVWLEFSDHQYLAKADRPTPTDVAPSLAEAIAGIAPSSVFLPMGLANPDHVLTHDAGLLAREQLGAVQGSSITAWFCYEEHGYKHIPGLLAWRVATLLKSGLWPTPAIVPIEPDMARKRSAIERYTSQIPPLEREHALSERLAANVPEQYWRLEPAPRGWEALASSI
jgi:LmbE family N-acetylglucosaminyl deacetylase